MHSSSIAEWIVVRFTDKQRAASMVGDLLELEPHKGLLWFWLSLVRVVISLAWRRSLAFVVAPYAGLWILGKLAAVLRDTYLRHAPPGTWGVPGNLTLLPIAGAFFWMVLLYTAIRYGLRDRVTQLVLALAGLITAVVYCWGQPIVLAVCMALGICVLAVSIMRREYRKATMVLLVAASTGLGGWILAGFLATKYQHHVYPGLLGDQELREHPSIGWVTLGLLMMTGWMITTACSRMHYWLMRDKQLDVSAPQKTL
ncbi:hypothetical protein [Edaphobacter aggregans]|uniref:hypothetical protein n=1 Tax=Edaphobacter aggregans TaxID=570835 RepID=UPI00055538ED|nr:hypothetical protein [Edaphobacter aggregans]